MCFNNCKDKKLSNLHPPLSSRKNMDIIGVGLKKYCFPEKLVIIQNLKNNF